MRVHGVRGIILVTLLTGLLAPAPASADGPPPGRARSPQECAERLDCGLAELSAMTMPQRLALLRALQSGPAQRFQDGFANWNAIASVIELFMANGMGARGSWVSYANAAVLEGIVRGLALASGLSGDDGGNPGARRWARYLIDLRAGRLDVKAYHNRSWGIAEQESVDWGVLPVNNPAAPRREEATLYAASVGYRLVLRHEPTIVLVLRIIDQPHLSRCHHWLTDVTNPTPLRVGGQFFVALGRAPADVPGVAAALAQVAARYPECARGGSAATF
ncbi:hypothetical protein [Thermomonospora umbrina]|uniref:Uncharacterized protein n=1 Tax=Thermomonospora umbrina TaxID=111806 RepID=A0A3D9SHZ5_9ACTN|nr:hypothetical protein [Thermomonospora umbrina]REE95548.1 hypothetical protein DFJ69_0938 [Thermomonospora umbrina]